MNHLNYAIDIVQQRLESELIQYASSAENLSKFTDIMTEIGINMAAVLDVRTTNTYTEYMAKQDNSWSSLMIDCSMELQVRMESELPGSYGELRDIVTIAAKRVAKSMVVPEEWEIDESIESESIDDCTILRVIVGYAMPLLTGRIAELIDAIRQNSERMLKASEQEQQR